jgi:hypothetical protein
MVAGNRVQRKICGPMMGKVTGDWMRLHTEELHDLYFSSNIVWVIKSRRMSCKGHVGEEGCVQGFGGGT